MNAPRTLRIGGACAFWGDSNHAVGQLVHGGNVDVLVFDYLAELTLSIMAAAKARNPAMGYATDFVKAVAPHLPEIAERRIRLLSNAGGMNPQACAEALRKAADAAGVQLRIAVVEGDDLLPVRDQIQAAQVREMFTGASLPAGLNSMNAYLGAMPVLAALRSGADVVITGRCVDSALALAALMHHFDWQADDYDRLAAGSLVGHILECTTQTTGGLFTDWWKVPGWENMGYPIAECEADGSFVLSKPPATGGLITPLVAAEQMLYEVTEPANYLLPDVCCDFTSVTITQVAENRVRFAGARGRKPTPTYKVSGTWLDGYRLTTTLTFVGADAVAMGRRAMEAILTRTRRILVTAGLDDFTRTSIEVLGSELPSFGAQARADAREVVVRLAVHHSDARALELLATEVAPMGVAGAPGTTGFSGRQKSSPIFRLFSFTWPKASVPVGVFIDNQLQPVEVPVGEKTESAPAPGARFEPLSRPLGSTTRVPLSAIAVARSGDKGDRAHLAVIARTPKFAALIGQQLTAEVVKGYFAHLVMGVVHRYDVPGIHAYNFVLDQALDGGGSSSLRNDPLGKTFGQIVLTCQVDVPSAWLDELEQGFQGQVATV
ncbi:acyclic terpene utilization AtuA family protein [Ottowia thiooxydans]|uniref:acyclic terpene utilization AtuA family protein n=1 Tax=Ottowia thiooxydans TaxID=219182 RepID=UPI0003FBF8B8|nr:acyclic terpene utilization AtuA family protein [Ottowia thiooxydans]